MNELERTQEQFKFRKGEHRHLDDIRKVHGLAGGDWWHPLGDDENSDIVILRDIKITVVTSQ